MTVTRALAGVALLGTRRAELPAAETDTALDQMLSKLGSDAETRLLHGAGTLALREAAGQVPKRLNTAPKVLEANAETRPRCSEAAATLLAALLDGRSSDLLPEFLNLLDTAGLRVPEEQLPPLLERGSKLALQRPLILSVIGETGRWLAAQNPNWRYASAGAETWDGALPDWKSSTMSTRQGILHQTRTRDPAMGRALLASSWKSETLATTVWMINAVATNLSMDDEPFLETALDDRNATVRRKAAELLSCLPESRLCKRMTEATENLLVWKADGENLEVNFPEIISPELTRDGVTLRKWKDQSKIRSAQVVDMVSAVPLSHWEDKWSLAPEAIIRGAQKSRWPAALLKGFSLAAERQKNSRWAYDLLRLEGFTLPTTKLPKVLPLEQFEALIKQLDDDLPLSKNHVLIKALNRWFAAWSPFLIELFLTRLEACMKASAEGAPSDLALRNTIKACARRCPLDRVAAVSERLETLSRRYPAWTPDLQDALLIANFRARMVRAVAVTEEPA